VVVFFCFVLPTYACFNFLGNRDPSFTFDPDTYGHIEQNHNTSMRTSGSLCHLLIARIFFVETQAVTVTTPPWLTDKFGPPPDPLLIPVAGLARKTGIKQGQ
jgi:hypothetical protein